jgi:pimeloyl-[acyl-carrier protein] methyl ester esterase
MESDRCPVVLLHGWALHGGLLEPLADALRAEGREATCLDLPGHGGRSYEPPFGSLDELAATIAADLPPACTLIGWSLGGMVAAKLAADGNPSLQALVLVATTPRFVAGDAWGHGLSPELVAGFAAELERDYRGLIRRFLSLQARGDGKAHAVLRELRTRVFARGEPDPAALAAGLGILGHADLRAAVARIRVPTLVISGEYDRLTPPGAGAWLAAHIPGARHVLIRGAGHAPFLSHAGAVMAALRGFLPRPVLARAGA